MVKIAEFHTPVNTDLNFDIVDDASVYMRNDPQFYRKEYYPTMAKMADLHSSGKSLDRSVVLPMVEKGIDSYCKKYKLGRASEDIFKQPDRDALIDKLFSEEMEQIKNGEYK